MKQKINGRSICLTVFLALLLLIVIASLWALFVSGRPEHTRSGWHKKKRRSHHSMTRSATCTGMCFAM